MINMRLNEMFLFAELQNWCRESGWECYGVWHGGDRRSHCQCLQKDSLSRGKINSETSQTMPLVGLTFPVLFCIFAPLFPLLTPLSFHRSLLEMIKYQEWHYNFFLPLGAYHGYWESLRLQQHFHRPGWSPGPQIRSHPHQSWPSPVWVQEHW